MLHQRHINDIKNAIANASHDSIVKSKDRNEYESYDITVKRYSNFRICKMGSYFDISYDGHVYYEKPYQRFEPEIIELFDLIKAKYDSFASNLKEIEKLSKEFALYDDKKMKPTAKYYAYARYHGRLLNRHVPIMIEEIKRLRSRLFGEEE